jgi:hypothetical protein
VFKKKDVEKRFTVLVEGVCVGRFDTIEQVRSFVARRPHHRHVVYDGRKAILLAA